jgi:hypothetical protein
MSDGRHRVTPQSAHRDVRVRDSNRVQLGSVLRRGPGTQLGLPRALNDLSRCRAALDTMRLTRVAGMSSCRFVWRPSSDEGTAPGWTRRHPTSPRCPLGRAASPAAGPGRRETLAHSCRLQPDADTRKRTVSRSGRGSRTRARREPAREGPKTDCRLRPATCRLGR